MIKEKLEKEAEEHCNEVMCSVCEHKTCDNTHLATLKCREWRDRRAGYYCGAEPREKRIEELEQEIRYECARCVYSDSPCIRSDYGVENDEDVCPNYKNVFTAYTQLKEENAKLKTDYEVLSCSVGDFGELQDKLEEEQRKNNGLSDNLTKAIELLKWALHSDPEHDDLVDFDTKWKEAEQFIREEK